MLCTNQNINTYQGPFWKVLAGWENLLLTSEDWAAEVSKDGLSWEIIDGGQLTGLGCSNTKSQTR